MERKKELEKFFKIKILDCIYFKHPYFFLNIFNIFISILLLCEPFLAFSFNFCLLNKNKTNYF